jgi:hypothetical protein
MKSANGPDDSGVEVRHDKVIEAARVPGVSRGAVWFRIRDVHTDPSAGARA